MGHEDFMRQAIDLAVENIKNGGGPFGAVIVKDGKVVATGANRVTANNDPTAHAEVSAIRAACTKLGTFDLSGCVIYTSCEPCPMCLAACLWANIEKIYFGCTLKDNESIGFRDKLFFDMLGGKDGISPDYLVCIDREECKKLFAEYASDKTAENY